MRRGWGVTGIFTDHGRWPGLEGFEPPRNDIGETMATETHPVQQKSAVAARQGLISGRVLLVLIASLILAVAGLVIGYWVVH